MATLASRNVGDVVGSYKLLRAVEESPARAVWETEDAALATFFAVESADRGRWATSLEASSEVTTAHSPEVLAAGEGDDGVWVVTRVIAGQRLAELLAAVKAPVVDWDEMLSQLAHALGELHKDGLAHGGLHPAAIVLAAEPPPMNVIVHELGAPRTAIVDAYLAPEALADPELRTPTADVWALGLIAFELVAGKPYFTGADTATLHAAIKKGATEAASARAKALGVPALPRKFDAYFAKCTAQNPTDRFRDGAAALEGAVDLLADESAVSEAIVEEPKPAGPPPLPLPMRIIKENPKQSIGLAVILAAAGLAGGLWVGKTANPNGVNKSSPMAKAMAFTRGTAADAKAACDGGNASACHGLGLMLAEGTKVPKDEAEAAKLFDKACNEGDLAACGSLAARLAGGSGIPEDRARAATLYRRACDGGELGSCVDLAQMLQTGAGVPKDPAAAAALLKRACDGGISEACPEK